MGMKKGGGHKVNARGRAEEYVEDLRNGGESYVELAFSGWESSYRMRELLERALQFTECVKGCDCGGQRLTEEIRAELARDGRG